MQRMRVGCWFDKARNTFRICRIYSFSTPTTVTHPHNYQ